MSRWDRLPADEVNSSTGQPVDQDRVNFGRHSGDTYLEVYLNDPGYVSWILDTMTHGEPNADLQRLATYFQMKQLAETAEADEWEYDDCERADDMDLL